LSLKTTIFIFVKGDIFVLVVRNMTYKVLIFMFT